MQRLVLASGSGGYTDLAFVLRKDTLGGGNLNFLGANRAFECQYIDMHCDRDYYVAGPKRQSCADGVGGMMPKQRQDLFVSTFIVGLSSLLRDMRRVPQIFIRFVGTYIT